MLMEDEVERKGAEYMCSNEGVKLIEWDSSSKWASKVLMVMEKKKQKLGKPIYTLVLEALLLSPQYQADLRDCRCV